MKAEYDFSKGERGKFYNADGIFKTPSYHRKYFDESLQQLADIQKKDVGEVVNDIEKFMQQLTDRKK